MLSANVLKFWIMPFIEIALNCVKCWLSAMTSGWNMTTQHQTEILHHLLGQQMNNAISNWNFRGIKPLFHW